MSVLKNKIDFVALLSVTMANSNGDPLNGNRPRTDYNGFGEISDVCIKRKLRNRMQDFGQPIFVQSDDRCDDGCKSLSERASSTLKGITDQNEYARTACETWLDVRTFGQVFAFKTEEKAKGKGKEKEKDKEKGKSKEKGISCGVRGPVSIHQAVSVSPVEIESMQITKSVNGDPNEGRSSDTMGMKHFVRFGLYKLKGSINVQLAQKTGFSIEDAAVLKEALRTLFVNDASSARPEGSMEVVKLYWFEHNCKDGQYPTAKVHSSVEVKLKNELDLPRSVEDYVITLKPLDGLALDELEGV